MKKYENMKTKRSFCIGLLPPMTKSNFKLMSCRPFFEKFFTAQCLNSRVENFTPFTFKFLDLALTIVTFRRLQSTQHLKYQSQYANLTNFTKKFVEKMMNA